MGAHSDLDKWNGKDYAANSRETIRRQTVHQFEQARLVDRNPDDPTRPTNSGDTVYQLSMWATITCRIHHLGLRRFSAAFVFEYFDEQYDKSRKKQKRRKSTAVQINPLSNRN